MKKTLHIAKANLLKHKSAAISLLVIITIVSMLVTIGLSILVGSQKDFEDGVDRMNGMHSGFVMDRSMYNPAFEGLIKEDPRVSQYEIGELFCPTSPIISYGGQVDLLAMMILNIDNPIKISTPKIIEEDGGISRENAVYLPACAKGAGFEMNDPFTITYRNKVIPFTVAGFFETSELGTPDNAAIKLFVSNECYDSLREHFTSSVMITVRLHDADGSEQFNNDFARKIDIELSSFAFVIDYNLLASLSVTAVSMFSAIIVVFALLFVFIYLLVISFRVSNTVESSMHEIGVMKASGYTSRQIINCYLMEYGMISLPAALLGMVLAMPAFPSIRQIMASMTGFSWTLGANIGAGIIAALLLTVALLVMVMRSCRRMKKLQPVEALRRGIAANNFRRNFFPLGRGKGGVHIRLGLKNMLAFVKSYVMIGIVIAGISLTVVFLAVLYQNFVLDQTAITKMVGVEIADVNVAVARHADADATAAEIEEMPQVRKTSMVDMCTFTIDGTRADGVISDDFEKLESMDTHDGRFPKHDNEVAVTKVFADRLGKKIGSSVNITVNGVSQEYMITGFYSVTNNGGNVGAVTLAGYQRLEPNYRRNSINVYLNRDVAFEDFSDALKESFGVVNVYKQDESSTYSEAKRRAEEKISNYLQQYDIHNVEYAVIYHGEMIISGSSSEYRIEKITDYKAFLKANIGSMTGVIALITQVFSMVSLIVVSLILSMTVRSIVAKRRRELGVMKASGYTARQLARQLAISFMPMTVIGVIIGCVSGASLVNPTMSAMLAEQGAYGLQFTASPLVILLAGLVITAVTFAVSNFFAMRIKKISVYELISE